MIPPSVNDFRAEEREKRSEEEEHDKSEEDDDVGQRELQAFRYRHRLVTVFGEAVERVRRLAQRAAEYAVRALGVGHIEFLSDVFQELRLVVP